MQILGCNEVVTWVVFGGAMKVTNDQVEDSLYVLLFETQK